MMFAIRRLLLAEVVSLRDGGSVMYPACQMCYSKVFLDTTSERYSCLKCGHCCGRSDVIMRYRLSLAITDNTALCNVTIFGKTLDKLFGCSAPDLSRMLSELKECYPRDVEEMFAEALATVFVGRMFYFGFKFTELFKNDKNVKVTIKELRNCSENSMKDMSNNSGLIALQMIPACEEDSAKAATVLNILKELLHQETDDSSTAQIQETSVVGRSNENNKGAGKNEHQTNGGQCADHEELSSYNQTDLILSCESLQKSIAKESVQGSSSNKEMTNSSPSSLRNKTRYHSCESADGSLVANIDHSHQSSECYLYLEDCNTSVTELHQHDLSCLPDQEAEKSSSSFSAYGMPMIPSSGCCVLPKQDNCSPTLNKAGSFKIKRKYASLNDGSSLPDMSAPYSEELDLFLQDLENELVFHETSLIPGISDNKLINDQNQAITVSHCVTQNLTEVCLEVERAKSHQPVITIGSSVIATPKLYTSSQSIAQLDIDSNNVTVSRSLDDGTCKRSLDYVVKGCNVCVKSSQSTDKGYTDGLRHFQHDGCEQEKCFEIMSTLCVSDKSCDLFDRSTDLFMDSSNWSSFMGSKENLKVNRLQQSNYSYSCVTSPVLRTRSKTQHNQNKFEKMNKKSLHFLSSDMLTISLGGKGNSDLGMTLSPLATATLRRSGVQRRLSKDILTEMAIKSTGNTLLHPISSTPKINSLLTSKPEENLSESPMIIQSSSNLLCSQDLFDQSSSPVHDYTDSPLSLSLPISHDNHATVPLPLHVLVTGQKRNLNNVSLKHYTQMKMQESLLYTINSSSASSSLDRNENCNCSEDLFSQDVSEQSVINETMLRNSGLIEYTDCSKDLFDDS